MMKQMKVPTFVRPQVRVPSSSFDSLSSCSCSCSSPSPSPSSVLPENPRSKNRKRPLSTQNEVNDQVKKKKTKVASTAPPLSPQSLRGALLRIRFADTILTAQKKILGGNTSDPLKVQKELAKTERSLVEEKKRVEAQLSHLSEAKRLADLESKKREEERKRLEQARRDRQRRKEKLARQKMEAVAADRERPYCCTLKQLGMLTRCDHGWAFGCWGGQYRPPLEKLGLFIKEDGFREVDLEEGEIIEELEEGEIIEELEEREIYSS